jgi:protein-tyrosine kinase
MADSFLQLLASPKEIGDMVQRGPDLIQRAAARLQAAVGGQVMPASPLRGTSSVAPVDRESATRLAWEPKASAGHRFVSLSPTSLAANAIALPGGGFSRTVEEFRAIKRNVIAHTMRDRGGSGSGTNRVILVTSARPSDGKTFAAINLALALAFEKDARVLLMDGDAYRQSLLSYLGISAETGWIDVLSGTSGSLANLVLQTNVPNLAVLPAGKQCSEIPELMSSQRMKGLFDELIREDPGRYIIVDSLPCISSTEPSILAALAGQTIFVVAAHQTSRDDIESSLRLLNSSPSVSLILNKAEPMLTEQFKYYGYNNGYSQ